MGLPARRPGNSQREPRFVAVFISMSAWRQVGKVWPCSEPLERAVACLTWSPAWQRPAGVIGLFRRKCEAAAGTSAGEAAESDRAPDASPANCASGATIAHMSTVASRDLRNHTADVLRQVAGGTHVTVTVNGTPVAEIIPARSTRPQFLSKAEFAKLVLHQSDAGLTDDLEKLAGETTADLDPL
jgi:prevent-host-death family protein